MRRLSLVFSILIVLAASFAPTYAASQEKDEEGILSRLLAPGPLMEGHAKLDGECLKCHEAGKGLSQAKCMACHKAIRVSVDSKSGFHGLAQESCVKCHSDHKGRDHDSTVVDLKSFDHARTGYRLIGKHAQIKCVDCHKAKRSDKPTRKNAVEYFGAKSNCLACHAKNDVHSFKGDFAKRDCAACHSMSSWKEGVKFDHAKDAKYQLEGKHAELKCADCHGPSEKKRVSQYKWPLAQQKCLACHDDFHKKRLGAKFAGGRCDACHGQKTWKLDPFDHAATGYPLRGKHSELKCEACHKQSPATVASGIKNYSFGGLRAECLTCHKDYHAFAQRQWKGHGSLGKCASCHEESSWQKTHDFSHDRQTGFALDGGHTDLKCEKCHFTTASPYAKNSPKNWIYKWPNLASKTCEACHASPHLQSFTKDLLRKKCVDCHVTSSWSAFKKDGKTFDHNQTRFPLTGKHAAISCKDCHVVEKRQAFKFPSFVARFCVDCHKSPHGAQFSQDFAQRSCYECHGTRNFAELAPFDHAKTSFVLKGRHAELKCAQCHVPTAQTFPGPSGHRMGKYLFPAIQEKACASCHADYHKGQLGADCAKCHAETTWKKTTFDHSSQSAFPLVGAHANAKCSECHKPVSNQTVVFGGKAAPLIQYKPLARRCGDCHADFHGGKLGTDCVSCHSPDDWAKGKFDHNKQSQFKLTGKHSVVRCAECHKNSAEKRFEGKLRRAVAYKPQASQCVDCHKDPHRGGFGAKCQECHSASGWKTGVNFHRNFLLSGTHLSLACAECHVNNRRLSGFGKRCVLCHQTDDVHGGTLPRCEECHRQQVWEISGFNHSLSRFPLTGAHRALECVACHAQNVYQGLNAVCGSCHLKDALNVSSPPHAAFPRLNDCGGCHNSFTFMISK